ncbi:ABC transporter permease [Paenibacillus naphthalenovorans]|uniref:ABC transporter permease n=1 Tax=Paenibacillus naphthalenovorans TaxID=162209 RepID=UPI0007842F58|nr:ABC transporter permease subunit [Paenibacillus naphthalenovorans]
MESVRRLLIAYLIAISVGTMLGFLFSRYRFLDETLGFIVAALQTVPSIVWLPFAIIWFGLNDTSVIFITGIGATWTMALSSRTGFIISPLYLRDAQTLGTGKGFRLFYQVLVPASFPHLMNGVRLTAWRNRIRQGCLKAAFHSCHRLDAQTGLSG